MDYISEVPLDGLQYLLKDMFKTSTLYRNKMEEANFKKLANSQYGVTLKVSVEKYRVDSLGRETLVSHDDYIDLGIYGAANVEDQGNSSPF